MSLSRSRNIAGAVLVAAAGLGLGAGVAHANGGPFTWCPGQSMDEPSGPNRAGTQYVWDMHVCHTWYRVSDGWGNVNRRYVDTPQVPASLSSSSVWEGDNPPPDNPAGVNCGLFFCPVPPHDDPRFHP
ncbi:hypothetical protein [Mycobacterium paraterrae]|uniref:Secreted protein n=1 Tax=Mycobacterium paraterrae TaxID=577492 RepID=A0ABY3VJX9_9MYCO|nr:hypothetical protein [Mycobacterium paraterrae]UMB69721.1 hypothetical protein MKK62_25905 [Mycobacterium paraterrae]